MKYWCVLFKLCAVSPTNRRVAILPLSPWTHCWEVTCLSWTACCWSLMLSSKAPLPSPQKVHIDLPFLTHICIFTWLTVHKMQIMCLFCNRGSSSSSAFQQHHPPDPWKWSLSGGQDCARHTREAQTRSTRPSYRRCTAECREPFGWAGKLCALTNVSNESLRQRLLH